MVSETAISNDHAKARLVYGRALAALVAAQANWSAISEVKGAERQVIETWATKAKVDLEKLDLKARSKLLDVANNALVSVALGSTRPKPEDKLGNLGLLSPRNYEVEILNPLKSEFADHGVTKHEILDAVNNPDAYQHLSPPPEFDRDAALISIFVRVLNRMEVAQRAAAAEWCVVIGSREGRKVRVRDSYRVSQAALTIKGESPLDLFRAFCEVYGCDLMVGSIKVGRFLLYQRIRGTGNIQADAPSTHKVQLSTFVKFDEEEFELAFGYAIDLTVYARALTLRMPVRGA